MRTAQQLLREALAWLDPKLNVSLCADIRQLLETPSVSAVAVVDADDNGLFVDIIYGKDGSALRQGDMLYAAPKPAVDGTVAMPEDWHKAMAELVAAMHAYEMDADGHAPEKHRQMMARANALLSAPPSPAADERVRELEGIIRELIAPSASPLAFQATLIRAEAALAARKAADHSPADNYFDVMGEIAEAGGVGRVPGSIGGKADGNGGEG